MTRRRWWTIVIVSFTAGLVGWFSVLNLVILR